MKRTALIGLIIALFVLSAVVNKAFAGNYDGTHPKNFIAVTADDQAILYWTMPKERTTSHFIVEHSVDGTFFVSLDTIAAEESNNFRYAHEHAANNPVNYYRLQQLDKNGDISYSHIRVVRFTEKNNLRVQAITNPLTDVLELTVVNAVKLVIKDANNKAVYKKALSPGQYQVNSDKWAPGKYELSVYENGKLVEKKSLFKFATIEPGEITQ